MRIEFGVSLPNLGGFPNPDAIEPFVHQMEELGYHSIFAGDHVALPVQPKSQYVGSSTGVADFTAKHDIYEAFTLLSYLAGVTTRLRLGIAVQILPNRHPVLNAKMISTLDVLSKGRVILGVGTGWCQEEFEALGGDFHHRGAVTDEHIRIYKEICTGEEVDFRGRYYQVQNIKVLPRPVQQPHPPIWVGGIGPNQRRRAATLGDGWYPIRITPQELAKDKKEVLRIRSESGLPIEGFMVALGIPVHFGDSPLPAAFRAALKGSPMQIVDQIKEYHEAGVDHFTIRPTMPDLKDVARTMERFANEVIPKI
jgi:probable F420-dependent oxidoreductase